MTLVEDLLEDIADMALIDEDTKPNCLLMQVAPPGGQIFYQM